MSFDPAYIAALKSHLENVGYANDEQDMASQSSHFAFKYHRSELFEALRQAGYEAELSVGGKFYPDNGTVIWIFDPEVVTPKQAEQLSARWVEEHRERNEQF